MMAGDKMNILTHSEQETIQFGREFAASLKPGDVIALIGDLGSGKTCLTRGICQGLNVNQEVTSPTFVLINEYRGIVPVYHFDFYRIEKPQDIFHLGIDDYLSDDSICVIEWADRALPILPRKRIEIRLASLFEQGKEFDRVIEVKRIQA